ncbi:MAG: hypothetical protein BroJett040_15360 [Oligoflexia bacterium]|nr:MAG: hypothetical protein BroJett040_15360 [Oligoflexia bacterium]
MKIARDIMTTNLRSIGSGEELRDTVKFFLESGIHYAPVVTPIGEVLGLFSEFGLLKAALRNYLDSDKHDKVINHRDLLEEAPSVYEDSSLDEVVKALLKSPTRRVLVTSVSGKLTGIISPKDLLFSLHGEETKTYEIHRDLEKTKDLAKKLTKKVQALEDAISVYQNFIQDSPNMIHSLDKDGKIIMANKKIHHVLGYNDDELIGKSIQDLYPRTVLPQAIDALNKIKEDGIHKQTYSSMLKKSGEKIRVDIASSALHDAHGKFIGTISISREIDSESLLRALNGIRD